MNQRLAREVRETVGSDSDERCSGLACEAQLRAAAATLADAPPDMITATTVVGVLGQDDRQAFEELVAEIADEFGLETQLRLHVGTFSVRFSRPVMADDQRLVRDEASTRR